MHSGRQCALWPSALPEDCSANAAAITARPTTPLTKAECVNGEGSTSLHRAGSRLLRSDSLSFVFFWHKFYTYLDVGRVCVPMWSLGRPGSCHGPDVEDGLVVLRAVTEGRVLTTKTTGNCGCETKMLIYIAVAETEIQMQQTRQLCEANAASLVASNPRAQATCTWFAQTWSRSPWFASG